MSGFSSQGRDPHLGGWGRDWPRVGESAPASRGWRVGELAGLYEWQPIPGFKSGIHSVSLMAGPGGVPRHERSVDLLPTNDEAPMLNCDGIGSWECRETGSTVEEGLEGSGRWPFGAGGSRPAHTLQAR